MRARNLRVRPVPEMEFCLVFRPDDPDVYTLNPTAWLIFELCDRKTLQELEAAYYAAIEPLGSREQAARDLRIALRDLQEKGLVQSTPEERASINVQEGDQGGTGS